MKCWKCGKDITTGADACIYCGTKTKRPEPASEAGKALRQLYDHYGAEHLLSDPVLLSNGYGDLCPDDTKFRNQLKLALDAGINKLYLAQINATGKPDSGFLQRVRTILSEDAGLSETDVTITKCRIDFDDGVEKYEVEFRTADGYEYEYELDAKTGKILDKDVELDN